MDLLMLVVYGIGGTIIAVPAGVLVLPLVLLFRTLFIWPVMRNSLLRKAVQKGNVVKARKAETTGYMLSGESATRHAGSVSARYEYEYAGQKYFAHLSAESDRYLADELELYFVKNPKKACVAKEIGAKEPNILLCYLLSVGIVWVSVVLFGVFYVSGNIL